jgi:flagellar biosynthesis protein FlhF
VQYQTFRGVDVQEALSAVKAALGQDAVIESTRHVSNGRRGGFSQSFVEITAAPPQGGSTAWPFSPDVNRIVAVPTRGNRPHPYSLQKGREPSRERDVNSPTLVLGTSVHELEREMVALRTMLEELNSKRSPKDRALAMLYAVGIDGRIAKELVCNLGKSGRSSLAIRGLLVERLRARLRVSPNLIAQSKRQMIVCVGPTGAGKTTTLAKLAARARLDHGRSVAVISLDTFRVGAIEQWQRYARLIGTSFAVARTAQDFENALASSTAELVLVDTSGRHVADTEESWPLVKCLPHVSRHELHVLVVLPAFLRGRDAELVTRSYADVRPSGAVVTKLDETSEIGGVLQAMLTEEVPIVYTCNGPRVPEDIREADAASIIQCLLPPDA